MAYFTDTTAKPNALQSWIQATLADLAKRRRARRAYRQTYDELAQLSDRELADLGMGRGNLGFVARQAAELA